jgi:hypothetical protein
MQVFSSLYLITQSVLFPWSDIDRFVLSGCRQVAAIATQITTVFMERICNSQRFCYAP